MANHKSAAKAHARSLKNAAINSSRRSRIKTFVKKVDKAVAEKSYDDAKKALSAAESEIMKGVTKGIYKLNKGSRMVSALAKSVKTLDPNALSS